MREYTIPADEIGFDFDGVIADIGEAFLRLACDEFGYCSIKPTDLTSFNVEACTTIPDDIVDTIFASILADSLGTGLLPISGAPQGIEHITRKAKLTIITARALATPVMDWLNHYISDPACRQIEVVAMSDHDQKVKYIAQHNLQFFIDDRAETCAQVAQAGFTPILFRQPWNSSWSSFHTVSCWQDITNLLQP